MATEDTIQNLIRLDRLYFRALRSSYAKTTFYMNRKELLVLGISTVKELKLFDEGSWVAHVSRVKWNQQEAGKAGVFYRTDLLRMAKAGDLEHIPGKAEVDKVYFKTACPLLILSIRERLQELRLDIESDLSTDVLAMCKWPGRDVINSINLNAQDPNVLMRIKRIEEKYLSCFRMLKRVIQGSPPEQPNKDIYREIDFARRKLTIGEREYGISNKIWAFLKDLRQHKNCNMGPVLTRTAHQRDYTPKNARDMLRKNIKPHSVGILVCSVSGGYELHPDVKLQYGSQVGIRRTKHGTIATI